MLRRIVLYGILAVCIAATVVGVTLDAGRPAPASHPAVAAAHPPVFTFTATRAQHSIVQFRGRFAAWSAADARYERGSSLVAVDIQDGAAWTMVGVYATDPSGRFSGRESIPGAYPVRARATDPMNRDLATSQSAMLPFAHRTTVEWVGVTVQRVRDGYSITGSVFGVWARDPVSRDVDYLGRYPGELTIQAQVPGGWQTLAHVPTVADGAFEYIAADSPGTTFRVKAPKSPFYAGSSTVVRVTDG